MAPGSTVSLNGRIEKTDLPTLLRSVEKDKNSGELSFNRSGDRIDLYFLFGQLYHAKWGNTPGLDAVTEVLTWKNGNYSFTEGVIPAQASINDDIERILSTQPPMTKGPTKPATGSLKPGTGGLERRSGALPPNPGPTTSSGWASPAPAPPPTYTNPQLAAGDAGGEMSGLVPFDLASLDSMNAVFPLEGGASPVTNSPRSYQPPGELENVAAPSGQEGLNGRVAPSPPAGGLYRTRLFCLPTGEQMATSLVATGPQLEEELLHLAEVRFTGYVLGGPEVSGLPTVGVCLLRGRFIHAFYHLSGSNGLSLLEGERAYRTALDQRGSGAARFYWFYELTTETMRAAISLLTPPTRYAHLEVRILRFKELLRLLNEESYTGTIRITIPSGALGNDRQPSALAGERAYIPIFQGTILGLWSENSPRLTNDGQLLQRFLNEPQAYLDLHATATVSDPGLPLESLVSRGGSNISFASDLAVAAEMTPSTGGGGLNRGLGTTNALSKAPSGQPAYAEPAIPVPTQAITPSFDGPAQVVDDDERQLLLITSIGRMESTWTQQKSKNDQQKTLLILAGFANEVLSITESVNGRRGVQDMIQRAMRQELVPYRAIFQLLDIAQGRVNIGKLLREYELFSRDSSGSAEDFTREAGRGLRTLLRSAFQYYVSLIRSETTRFESQDMYEVFLQDVVKKM